MVRAAWTPAELADVAVMDWPVFKARYPHRVYNAWEVKRRRVQKDAPAVDDPRGLIQVPGAGGYAGPLVAFFDLETTYATQPRLLSAAIADGIGDVKVMHLLDDSRVREASVCEHCEAVHVVEMIGCAGAEWIDDSVLAATLRDELEQFHIFVGWNSALFDEPVLNFRLAFHGERTWDPLLHKDLMYEFSGRKMRLGRRSLENVSTVFGSPHRKTPLNPQLWDRADHGDVEAYERIIEHNIADVLVTRDVFAHARPRIRKYIRGGG